LPQVRPGHNMAEVMEAAAATAVAGVMEAVEDTAVAARPTLAAPST